MVLVSSSLHEALATVERRAGTAPDRRRVRAGRRACGRVRGRRGCSRGGCAGWRRRPSGSPRASSTSRSRTTGPTRSGELARTFDRMRQRLAQLDHARREFIANASHELRTPVFSLGGFLELMRDEELDEGTRREFLATMSEQVDRLAKLATELLDLSRADAGRLRVERGVVDLDGGRGDGGGRVHRARRCRPAGRFRWSEDGHAQVFGDEQRVLQVARALVENALVHTPSGTRVEVRASEGALEVEDDGPGIPSAARCARVRALLPRGGPACLRQRARVGDRARAGAGDGRNARARKRVRPDGVQAAAAGCGRRTRACVARGKRHGKTGLGLSKPFAVGPGDDLITCRHMSR